MDCPETKTSSDQSSTWARLHPTPRVVTTPTESVLKKACAKLDPYFSMWLTTQLVDYALLAVIIVVGDLFCTTVGTLTLPMYLAALMPLSWVFLARDEMHGRLFSDMLARVKTEDKVAPQTLEYYMSNNLKVCLVTIAMVYALSDNVLGVMDWHSSLIFDEGALLTAYTDGLTMLAVRDVIFGGIHWAMHEFCYSLHKKHHTPKRNLRLWNGFEIDLMDFFISGLSGPVFYLPLLYLVAGFRKVHLLSFIFTFWVDLTIHSMNPYAVVLWNPVLDAIFSCNVAHALHHICTKGWYFVVPWHQILPSARQADWDKYNRLLDTRFCSDPTGLLATTTAKADEQCSHCSPKGPYHREALFYPPY